MPRQKNEFQFPSRRAFLKSMGLAPVLLHPAPFFGYPGVPAAAGRNPDLPYADVRLTPHYPVASPLEDVLRLVPPGSDEYPTEKYAWDIQTVLEDWGRALQASVHDHGALETLLSPSVEACALTAVHETPLRSGNGITITRRFFPTEVTPGRDRFVQQVGAWLGQISRVETAEFAITSIDEIGSPSPGLRLDIRYDVVAQRDQETREERIGLWHTEWSRDQAGAWKAHKWTAGEETACVSHGPMFLDVTPQAFHGVESYPDQMLRGSDYWRTVLDGACGIDVYGNNGLAVGDYNGDGYDDLYVCQPSGLPNRLYRNRGDGTFEDVTEKSGVGVLDNTACALFADFENKGLQDLLVVCGSGPLLFVNQGDGTFAIKRDAFKFERVPQGTFTHAAVADYDGDGKLDIYFCLYSYYLGLDQYHYPVPYYDARNGPPNYLLHNEGNATFADKTEAAGLNAENDRYSFACAWGSASGNGLPDLCVANDFGRANLYRNNANGTFTAVSAAAHINDPGAGMSAAWCDCDNDGKQDIYIADMWSAAGQRVSSQKQFHEKATEEVLAHYRRHARGNALYRNLGGGIFQNASRQTGVEMGRWSWSSDFWDFDQDGFADLYVANGYISAPQRDDLSSFFWRQVVGKSPDDSTPTPAYERGWNAINELIRSDHTWNGYERNVMFANNHDGTFTEVSGAVGLDLPEDSRSFVLADIDHDGRLEVIVKNRNAPQLRVMHNMMKELGDAIAFRLKGNKSNRDAIGACVVVEVGALRQTKYLQAGSGFAAQHSKEVFFGVGKPEGNIRATVHWPGGSSQEFQNIPGNHRITIEEGFSEFKAEPFASIPRQFAQAGPVPKLDPLPAQAETWLIEPLKAPPFSLPDMAGNVREGKSLAGGYLLLTFWAASAPHSGDQLKLLEKHTEAFEKVQLQVLAINVDAANDAANARSFAGREKFSFPVLFATEEVAGVYNIIYRYLFDRRRDLGIPSAFLVNSEGMIVKLYQGPIQVQSLLNDIKDVPATPADRVRKALPYRGVRYHDEFQRNDFTYGVALFQHGYLDAAAASFEQVIAQKPDNAEAYYNLGTLQLRRNNLNQGREYMGQAIKLRSNYPEAWNNLGMIAAQQGQAEEAVRNFEESLNQRPRYAIALVNLGNLYRRQQAYDKALTLLTRALEIQPDDPETNYSLGMLYAQQEQAEPATRFLRKAIALRPDYPEARNNLGVLFTRTGDYAGAREQFETCIRIAPHFDQSYMNLARLYVMQNDKAKAIEALQELLQVQPQHPGALRALEMLRSQP